MRMMHGFVLTLGLLLLATPAAAAGIDGNWRGSLDTPNGTADLSFTFKADGAALSGSSTGPDGSPTAIKNGKIDGDKITFDMDLDFGGMPVTLVYAGVVSGNKIAMTIEIMGMTLDVVLTKTE